VLSNLQVGDVCVETQAGAHQQDGEACADEQHLRRAAPGYTTGYTTMSSRRLYDHLRKTGYTTICDLHRADEQHLRRAAAGAARKVLVLGTCG
jgi:hypothetical protein